MDQEDTLRNCLDSLVKHTKESVRVFIVNNGAHNIKRYLDSLTSSDNVDFEIVHNESNVGFIRGNNQVFPRCDSKYILLLNNDTIVTDGWLSEMIAVCEENEDIGLVNPKSNNFTTYPKDGETIDDLAVRLKNEKWRVSPIGICSGFCLFFPKTVLDKIGPLDEDLGEMFFEDADFSMRVKRAGYKCVTARRSYVYHIQHKGMEKRKSKEVDDIFEKSKRYFEDKWGSILRILFVAELHKKSIKKSCQLLDVLCALIDDDNRMSLLMGGDAFSSREEMETFLKRTMSALHICSFFSACVLPFFVVFFAFKKIKKPYDLLVLPDSWIYRMISTIDMNKQRSYIFFRQLISENGEVKDSFRFFMVKNKVEEEISLNGMKCLRTELQNMELSE